MKCIAVRYGEIGTKSDWVRTKFEKKLADNIRHHLKKKNITFKRIERKDSRLYVYAESTKRILGELKKVPGIVNYSSVEIVGPNLEDMEKAALKEYRNSGEKTFRITGIRANKKYPMQSMEVAKIVGAYIVEKTGAKVSLEQPDINIVVEIRERNFVYSDIHDGLGGLPIGSEARFVGLISDSMESRISILDMIRRGCRTVLLHFGKDKKKIKNIIKHYDFIDNEFYSCGEKLGLNIIEESADREKMIREAERIAEENSCYAIVCGDDIKSLKDWAQSRFPVLFPCSGLDREMLNRKIKLFGLESKNR